MITQHSVDTSAAQGKERGLSGGSLTENPHSAAQGSKTRPLAFAWRAGFLEGQSIRALDDLKQAR